MHLTQNEKLLIKDLVKKELERVEEEGASVTITEDKPGFLAMEEKYDIFLNNLLKKLE